MISDRNTGCWQESAQPAVLLGEYIKWTVFVNVTTKSAQHAHARMIAIIVEKSPNSSHMYDHGFMDNTNRQAVCKSQKNHLSDSQTAEELHWKP